MLLEGYIAKWKKYPTDEEKIRVARPSRFSPSRNLLFRFKNGTMSWEDYEKEFREEMYGDLNVLKELRDIGVASRDRDIRLICYEKTPPCHRFILMDIINELQSSKEGEEQCEECPRYGDESYRCSRTGVECQIDPEWDK